MRLGVLFATLIHVADPESHSAALNMALDEVLLESTDAPLVRIYRWARPAVSFGYFGKHAAVAEAYPDREVVRRWTGGGVVPHGEDLTYTLVVPREHSFFATPASDSYRLIHECIAGLFTDLLEVRLTADAAREPSTVCFANPSQFDVLSGDVKIAGAAQRRTKLGLLHQGSIQGVALPADAAERLPLLFSSAPEVRQLTAEELSLAEEIARSKYATEAWTRRW
ncbi:MAG TPA: hypothetical protein VF614_14400 [Chthoniobacteraceae bacterium]